MLICNYKGSNVERQGVTLGNRGTGQVNTLSALWSCFFYLLQLLFTLNVFKQAFKAGIPKVTIKKIRLKMTKCLKTP